MEINRVAAFSDGESGGNPAGVAILQASPDPMDMQRIAAEIGYSETAFAWPSGSSDGAWRVRYFSPESEVPFCGHATIALGAVLAKRFGPNAYRLELNAAAIQVEGATKNGALNATLSSPPTHSRAAEESERADALRLFGLTEADLDPRLPAARIHAGADHLMLALRDRESQRTMAYDLAKGREIMNRHGLITIMLVHIKGDQEFDVRNAFASGGVFEDPATGAAAAAFAGYLRDRSWPHGGAFRIIQGEDMGVRSIINVRLTDTPGASVEVSGTVREISPPPG
ncbi:MAG: PhzF family phenazine biosynthesis protein [Alphaproteobacteria bacterium]|nr:PhzF family phenazine biosynthesis protein [Alphaproteobacteria bacterium]